MNLKGGARLGYEAISRLIVGSGLLASMIAGLILALRWRLGNRHESLYPPPPRYPIARWSGSEVAAALLLFVIIPDVALAALQSAGVLPAFDRTRELDGDLLYKLMVVHAAVAPVRVAAVLGVLWLGSRTRPNRLGLRLWRWQPNLYMAYVCYLVVTPIVLGLNYLANWLNKTLEVEMQNHPLQRLAQSDPRFTTLLLVILHAVVLAPLVEEIVFRGVMLPWLSRRWWGGWAAMAGAITMGLMLADKHRAPLSFALGVSLLGIALTFPHAGEQWSRRAIIGTGLLFAMFHATVWPTPVPLLALGLALGWVAHRTRGLLAPIVLHALFNATSTLLILAGAGN